MVTSLRVGARSRRWPLVVIVTIVLLAVLFTLVSGFVIDLMWYREIDQSSVFWTTLRTKTVLGLIFGLVFFGLVYASVSIARWITPQTRVLTPDQEVIERIRDTIDPYIRWALPLGVGVLALFVGIGVSREWQTYLLWRNGAGIAFGVPEDQFGRDPAFYVFTLPWLRFVQGWLFSTLVGVTFLTAIAHVLWGGIRPQAPAFADKVAPPVRAHLSVLLGLIMFVKAWGYWLGRFDLLTSTRGVVQGASYTDVNAQLPALNFLAIVAVICGVLFLINIRVRLWSLPIIAVALLAVVSVLLGTAYPAFIQQFRVKPNEQQYELPYIERNIEGTRHAFGLDLVQEPQERPVREGPLTAQEIRDNQATVDNIRLWRPDVLVQNFRALQRIRSYYEFRDVDVDRYPIGAGDERRVLMVSGREISQNGIPEGGQSWVNRHLAYTHGYGAVASVVNTANADGQPVLTLQGIPVSPTAVPSLTQPRIYYGEQNDVPFVIVGAQTPEVDYEGALQHEQYQGEGGIAMGNIFTRAMFAWKFRDVNLLISGQIRSDSRILLYRDIQTRIPKAVPFLSFDSDPYLAIVDGGLKWIWDAYTTTTEYPYAQTVDVGLATDDSLAGDANYMRNSVKAVVDAYDGTIEYYADLGEPIIQAWGAAFPGLFTDIGLAPEPLRDHFRYPENLFQVQAFQWANYHVDDPSVFYQKQDFWQVPFDPTVPLGPGGAAPKLAPYYQLMRLPTDETEGFLLVLPFVPQDRQNMVAWMAASSDPDEYGKLVSYRFPAGQTIDGPSQIVARINADRDFSSRRSLLDQAGSSVAFGDFLVIPLEDSFLYVQPVYVQADTPNSIPELGFVIVVNGSGGPISLGTSLEGALAQAVAGEEPPVGPGQPGGGGTLERRIEQLLAEALEHFAAADAALTDGDLATYQAQLRLAQQAVQDARELAATRAGDQPSATPTPTPTPTVSGSPETVSPTSASPAPAAP